MNKINYKNFANGINFNIVRRFQLWRGDDGRVPLGSLYKVFFKREVCRFRPICWIPRF